MTLQASGQIAMSDINTEMGMSSSNANSSISDAVSASNGYPAINTASPSYPDGSFPHAYSEWYSYDHDYSAYSVTIGTIDCMDTSLQVSGAHSSATRVYVVIYEYDGAVANGSHTECVTPSGGSWTTQDWGGYNSGTDSVDVEAYVYTTTDCTGTAQASDTVLGQPCAT